MKEIETLLRDLGDALTRLAAGEKYAGNPKKTTANYQSRLNKLLMDAAAPVMELTVALQDQIPPAVAAIRRNLGDGVDSKPLVDLLGWLKSINHRAITVYDFGADGENLQPYVVWMNAITSAIRCTRGLLPLMEHAVASGGTPQWILASVAANEMHVDKSSLLKMIKKAGCRTRRAQYQCNAIEIFVEDFPKLGQVNAHWFDAVALLNSPKT